MENIFSTNIWLGAALIFGVRVLNISLDTLRVLYVMRGQKWMAWLVGFFVSLIYVLLLTSVINNLDNPWYVLAYAAGFATGGVVGIWLEERLAFGYLKIQVISALRGALVAEKLRQAGFAVTEISARGKDGMVTILSLSVRRKQAWLVKNTVLAADEEAFVTSESVQPIQKGYWRA